MERVRSFFASIYGIILFTVVLVTLACVLVSFVLPLTFRFEFQVARADATPATPIAGQPAPSVLPITIVSVSTTVAPTASPTASPTSTPTVMPLPTATLTPTEIFVPTATITPTLTPAPTAIVTPTLTPAPSPAANVAAPPGVDAEAQKAGLLELVNALRVANGCAPLQVGPLLQQIAQAHAEDMRDHRKIDHVGSDGVAYRDRLVRAGYQYERAGENITNWFATPQDVMKQWTEGEEIPDGPHRKNILNCVYTETGIGLAYRDDGVPYWVLDLAKPKV